jgi:hypothetical protein
MDVEYDNNNEFNDEEEEPLDTPYDPNAGKSDYKLFSLRDDSVIDYHTVQRFGSGVDTFRKQNRKRMLEGTPSSAFHSGS